MTKLELIRLIGDVLTEIDMAIGSLLPSDPHQPRLQDLRILLDDRQRKLSQQVFDDNAAAFQSAAQQLQGINDQIRGTIHQVQKIENTIDNIKRFLDSVTSLVTTVGALI